MVTSGTCNYCQQSQTKGRLGIPRNRIPSTESRNSFSRNLHASCADQAGIVPPAFQLCRSFSALQTSVPTKSQVRRTSEVQTADGRFRKRKRADLSRSTHVNTSTSRSGGYVLRTSSPFNFKQLLVHAHLFHRQSIASLSDGRIILHSPQELLRPTWQPPLPEQMHLFLLPVVLLLCLIGLGLLTARLLRFLVAGLLLVLLLQLRAGRFLVNLTWSRFLPSGLT